ncbi:RNA-directed DNA polymerase, eukaryota, reverse transcriptase zinc-binding domain protein, partial [Tanacetum coccineum]
MTVTLFFLMDAWCTWSWRVPPRGRTLDDLSNLINLIGNVSLSSDADDKWVWMLHPSGALNLKALSSMIQDKILIDCNLGKHHVCNSWVSRKINVCTWRASLDWLHSLVNLMNRGFVLPSQACRLCERGLWVRETADLEDIFLSIQNSSRDSLPAIKTEDIFSSIQRLSMLWISKRCLLKSAIWSV